MEKRINKDKKTPGVCLELRKSNMFWDIAILINNGVITYDDIGEFSDDLKDAVNLILQR